MPGLNQLKTFSEDIRDVGDEVKLRAQRGEKPVSIPLPSGISEEDDSDDFIIGIPEVAGEEVESQDENPDNAEIENNADISNLDNLLEPQISADEDALADFLNDSLDEPADIAQTSESDQTEEESVPETPLEDLDLESLLQTSSDGAEQDFSEADSSDEINLNEDIPASVLENDGIPAQKEDVPAVEEPAVSEPSEPQTESQALEGLGNLSDLAGMDSFDMDSPADSSSDLGDLGSFDIDSLISDTDSPLPDNAEPEASSTEQTDFASETDSLPDFGEIPDATTDVPDFSEETSVPSEDVALDSFDTSAMEGVDFGPAEPPSPNEFPVTGEAGDEDDFILDSSFEIPGFSDTETADLGKKRPLLDTVDFSKGKEDRPKNSLTDEEYVQFKKNLANYPLNLRIALEDFISRDEFTDEAVFEIIEKVLKKTSARQLATQLEKILDVSINIPRDFERRSFAEYEAYKQSFQYQLKNRIIPAAIVGVILCFVCFGLFKAGVHFIYKPVMANIHYKQGYTLLEENEFPQSEQEFKTAVSYRPVKKWFFKYAEGYRLKKQFDRAATMYRNILAVFNHDKQAGLDYAAMELYDRANYERAEEITRREVLDYHINDADGILMLGDVFLEWAEVDDSKYELAKQQYLDLIQRYGSNNTYLARMLRYNIRTDKLRDVLSYKNMFYQSKQDRKNLKNLSSEDWTELSGYLLEKLYGTLSKNDEYLRSSIEDVLAMLNLAIKSNPANPQSHYNLARYFVYNGYTEQAKTELEKSLDLFDAVSVRTKKNVYREINASRILGELYADAHEYLKAQTVYTRGINLYNYEHETSDFEGDLNTGRLFADMGDLDYFISGELDDALYNYEKAIEIKNDTPSINFRVGAIYYGKKDYDNALASFIKVSEKEPKMPNVLLSLGNVLSLRGDNFAAESYYSNLLEILDTEKAKVKYLTPQNNEDDYEIVDLYLKANNNLGVTLYRLAKQTGNSDMNAQAMVRLSDSIRAYDSLTRNPQSMIRMEGSNLAAQNSKYITHPYPDFEPAIYTDIPRILNGDKVIE